MASADEAAAALGLVIVQPAQPHAAQQPPTFWLWPDSLPLWQAWHQVQTQWRSAGMEGQRTGLCYAGVTAWLQGHGWHHGPRRSLRHALDCIAAMEGQCLEVWAAEAARKRLTPKA
jgi:hypothetical protein